MYMILHPKMNLPINANGTMGPAPVDKSTLGRSLKRILIASTKLVKNFKSLSEWLMK
jgi:hypothetical protein